jgi:lipopolysaccharide transport system ATP-binding protein
MSDTVIRVENLSKRYFITHQTRAKRGHGSQLTEKIQQWVSHPVRRMLGRKGDSLDGGKTEREEFWVLKDVSFEVKRGEWRRQVHFAQDPQPYHRTDQGRDQGERPYRQPS